MVCPKCGETLTTHRVRARRSLALGLCISGVVLAYALAGAVLHDFLEGLQRTRLPLWKVWVPVVVLGTGVLALRVRHRHRVCAQCGHGRFRVLVEPAGDSQPERRLFLRILGTSLATMAAGAAGILAALARNLNWVPVARDFFFAEVETSARSARQEWNGARVRSYRKLGRTGFMVSDISFGSARIRDADVARLAIERGVNYFDTAPDYAAAESERVLGEAIRGHRQRIFLATKFCRPDGHLPDDTPVAQVIEAVESSLRRLQTDYVDLIHIHACDRLERLMAPNIHEAFDRLREQGKVRFLGVSSHAPSLESVAHAAIDSGRFDVIMLAQHHGMWRNLDAVMAKARAHGVGVVAMKTLKGAKHTNLTPFRDRGGAYSQAAFRWVLSNPNISCLVASFSTAQQVDEYLYASGTALTASDKALLEHYDELIAGDYCQPHCGACLGSCPQGLPIHDILRYRMYFQDYGWVEEGVRLYATLVRNAAACARCPAPCSGACPCGLPIRDRMLEAHRRLAVSA